MKIDIHRYETLTGIRAHYDLRTTTLRMQVSRAAEDGEIGAVELADGTIVADLDMFVEWSKSKGRKEKFATKERAKLINAAEYMKLATAAETVGINHKSVCNAVDREEIPIVTLPFGTRLIRPADIQQWEKDYQTKTYEADVGALFTRSHKKAGWRKPTTSFKTHNLSRWAEISKIPARVLLQRINDGWTFSDALITPVGARRRTA